MVGAGAASRDPAEGDARASGLPRRLADIVYEQLFRLIRRGEFPQGCKMPPEADLAERFGVSRPIVRDALARLKDEGYVRSQRGSGSVVVRGERPGLHAYPPIHTIADLLRSYEFRITVETATAAMAAERRLPADLADLARTLDRAGDAIDKQMHHLLGDLNFDFHRAVARATHNPFYLKTVEMIPNFIGADQLHANTFGAQHAPAHSRRVHDEHLTILEAIRAREPELAVQEMERHIAAARDFVLERQQLATGRGKIKTL